MPGEGGRGQEPLLCTADSMQWCILTYAMQHARDLLHCCLCNLPPPSLYACACLQWSVGLPPAWEWGGGREDAWVSCMCQTGTGLSLPACHGRWGVLPVPYICCLTFCSMGCLLYAILPCSAAPTLLALQEDQLYTYRCFGECLLPGRYAIYHFGEGDRGTYAKFCSASLDAFLNLYI